MEIRERLKMLRKERKESQESVARSVSIALRNYHRIESGDGYPSFHVLCALADHFQVNMDYLAGRTDIRDPLPPSKDSTPDMSARELSHGT